MSGTWQPPTEEELANERAEYTRLLSPNLDHDSARSILLAAATNGVLFAQDPESHRSRVKVLAGPAQMLHAIYKHPNGRHEPYTICKDHYKAERGERCLWIALTLSAPHLIRLSSYKHTYIYISKPVPNETFVAMIRRTYSVSNAPYALVTAYPILEQDERDEYSARMSRGEWMPHFDRRKAPQ